MGDSEKQTDNSSDGGEQKLIDLERARHRSLKRPGKKEKRFSEVDGRYIPPPELQKEIDKLAEEKAKAAQKKKGLRGRFARQTAALPIEAERQKTEELKTANRQIRELRGVKSRTKKRKSEKNEEPRVFVDDPDAPPPLTEEQTKRKSFLNTVRLLNAESAKPDAYKPLIAMPPQKKLPDGVLIDDIAYPVGVIYWDAHDLLADRVVAVRRVARKKEEVLLCVYAPDMGRDGFIPVNRIVRLYDLKTMTEIENPHAFITQGLRNAPALPCGGVTDVLAFARYELVLLAAVKRRGKTLDKSEEKLFLDYISARCGFIAFDAAELLDYIKTLEPDDKTFQEALTVLVSLPQEVVFSCVRAFLQLVLGGGVVRPKQRELSAELLYALRCAGIELNNITGLLM